MAKAPGASKNESVVAVSLLQPRIAVVLGVPKRWHPLLYCCRLLSIAPALWWGLRCALQLLVAELLAWKRVWNAGEGAGIGDEANRWEDRQLRLMETALAMIWCGASAYLSFFFTDCLMSRWLLNYTPSATLIRLLTISAINVYITSWVLYLTGGTEDPRLLLPAWISIATTLTFCYHVTQRKINIRKETSASISVFSIASFISMVTLLIHEHWTRIGEGETEVPLLLLLRNGWEWTAWAGIKVLGITTEAKDGL